jgi:RHS repeat-associated protein
LYGGEQYDSHLSQYYLRARYYDPANGRFNQIDPFGGNNSDPQSLHKYLYCHANPINNLDPSGNMALVATFFNVLNVVSIIATAIPFVVKTIQIGIGFRQLGALSDFMIELNRAPVPDLITKLQIRNVVGMIAIETVKRTMGLAFEMAQEGLEVLAFSLLLRSTIGFLRSLKEASAVAQAARVQGPITDPSRLLSAPKYHKHHIFPEAFGKYFERAQIDINKYTIEIEQSTHLRGVHGRGMGDMPGRWNAAWKQFFTENLYPTGKQIFQQSGKMMDEFGLSDLKIVPII